MAGIRDKARELGNKALRIGKSLDPRKTWLGPDRYPADPRSPTFEQHKILADLLEKEIASRSAYDVKEAREEGVFKKNVPTFLRAVFQRSAWIDGGDFPQRWQYARLLKAVLGELARQKPLLSREEMLGLLDEFRSWMEQKPSGADWLTDTFSSTMLKLIERGAENEPLDNEVRERLDTLRQSVGNFHRYNQATAQRLTDRILLILGEEIDFKDNDPWRVFLKSRMGEMSAVARKRFESILLHAHGASQSKPPNKWLKEADGLIEEFGRDEFREILIGCAGEIPKTDPERTRPTQNFWVVWHAEALSETDVDYLKGLVWMCSLVESDKLAAELGDAAISCFRKLPDYGPRNTKVGNACIVALSLMTGDAAAGQLVRLKQKVKYRSALRIIDARLSEVADRRELAVDELEEQALPTFGLDANGKLEQALGDHTAIVEIAGTRDVALRWTTAKGKLQTSVPKAVKENHAGELKELRKTVKDVRNILSAQRDRLESLFLSNRAMPYEDFVRNYLDHPLLSEMCRRLIWWFEREGRGEAAIRRDGALRTVDDKPLNVEPKDTTVRLWSPIGVEPERVLEWRNYLTDHGISQPFKQAHREVYLITDAELETETYSNRFASHIIRQHQFAALCRQRGWKYQLQGDWDGANTPTKEIAGWNLRAEFWVDYIYEQGESNAMGIGLYLTTDQVRFYDGEEREPMNLTDVPAPVFSEVMRDVDLFVGVCTIGNDPTWQDRGDDPPCHGYWQNYSFGELSASAETRKQILEGLVPRLKIADRCSFDKRSLVVRGDRGTYRIHLGSGNVMMEPGNRYLCIVTDRSSVGAKKAGKVWLPFEGDTILSIILSKAFLLAEDTKITDRTILSQIKGRMF